MLGSPYTRAMPFYLETTTNASPTEGIEQAENKFPVPRSAAVSGPHPFSEAAAVIDSRGKVCSYTNHFSSGKHRFNDKIQLVQSIGQRERYIM